jgi:thioredoxin-like negative regulator of GroEL
MMIREFIFPHWQRFQRKSSCQIYGEREWQMIPSSIGGVYLPLIELNDDNFDDFVNNNSYRSLVLIDFYKSQGCGRCELHVDVLRNLADEFSKNVNIARIDVDKNSIVAMRFRLIDFPTIAFFLRGQAELISPGVKGAGTLRQMIRQKLGSL